MYYGPRQVSLYEPKDIQKIASGDVGMTGADIGKEMQKASNHLDTQDAMAQQEHDMNLQQSMYQAAHERNLQADEQRRRDYDSESNRMGQQQKYSVLGHLLNRTM